MTITSTWHLLPPTTTEELRWAESIGCAVRVEQDRIPVLSMYSNSQVAGRTKIEIVSGTNEQETMLKLRFTDRLWLKSIDSIY